MDLISEFLKEIKTKHYFLNISMIEQINSNISDKLNILLEQYKNTNNKYLFVAGLVRLGYELEKSINNDSNDILSLQMKNISGLIIPIISRIKKICSKLNLELVDDLKKYILELIEEDSKNNSKNNSDIKKNIKFMNIIGFCRNVNYVISKELLFEDFGIVINISNPYYKNFFTDLIEKIGIFTLNEDKHKRFDWFWKPLYNYDLEQLSTNTLKEENFDIYKNISQEPNFLNSSNLETNNSNIKLEEFKIIQKSLQNNIEIIENKLNNEFLIDTKSKKQNMSILSNSIIIEDESFSIPIDKTNNIDYTYYS
jgi:hypothetical protein